MRGKRLLPALALAVMSLCCVGSASADTWYSVNDPIDPAYLTEMPFGMQSQWIQQWRAYLDTPPATALADGMGVNFNVPASQAQVTAQLLAASGIKRARYEISWSSISYSNPTAFADPSYQSTVIAAMRNNGIRPLILLNANAGTPCPTKAFTATLTAAAPAGATTVQLDAATAAQVVPGYSGLNSNGDAAGIIFTAVNASDVATLSRPLPSALSAGAYPASTLLYQPFAQPLLADGSPNPQFEATLTGWLDYVRATMNLVTAEYGSDNFDVEIWNELGFGSDFLNLSNYYQPLPNATEGNTDDAILDATVSFLRDPANGWPDVQIGNGFTNQTGVDSGALQPVGLNAIDKHPYSQLNSFPAAESSSQGLNALGQPDYTYVNGKITPNFVPTYNAFFPEYWLTGLQSETLIRDIAPIETTTKSVFAGGLGADLVPLGRNTAPLGGSPLSMWVTEDNMDPTVMNNVPDALTASDYAHIHAKAALRTYVSDIGKGVQAVDLYAVDGYPQWNLVDPAFFTAAEVGTTGTYSYPGTALGGPVMDATRRLAATLAGAQTITTPRPLSLLGIATDSTAYQWLGDGTAAHPTLYDRDVLFFQPFQLTSDSWVAAVYVMTRNIAEVYNESLPSTDPTRTDLPPENYQITVGGVDAANLTASATDPLSGASVPVEIISRQGDVATLQLPVTDSPRMVTLDDPPSLLGVAPPGVAAPSVVSGATSTDVTAPGTRARSGSKTSAGRLSVTSRIVRVDRGVYLQLECAAACRVRWSLQWASGAPTGHGRSQLLKAHRRATIRIATVSSRSGPRRRGTVSIVIVNPRTHATIERHLTVNSSLLAN